MAIGLLGKKLKMTTMFDPVSYEAIPVTIIEAGPCYVVQKKNKEKDGYTALQLGFCKAKRIVKSLSKQFEKINIEPLRHLKEFRIDIDKLDSYTLGQELTVEIFSEGEEVDINGISKGKGFAGIIKKHGAKGGPASHGSMFHRQPGSIGGSSDPSRVFKGASMPGRMGTDRITIRNLKIIHINKEKNLLFVKGGVVGNKGSILKITKKC